MDFLARSACPMVVLMGALSGCGNADAPFDPNDPRLLTAGCSLPADRLFDGGPGLDGIPALRRPEVAYPPAATFLPDEDRVLGVVINGVARAYALRILWWHEVINDTLGGEPVVVTYCPLTGSGLAFDPRVDGGPARDFGVSGLLYENNLIMFDRETRSLWNQLLLGAQCGPARGTELRRVPVVETNWRRWRELYPSSSQVTTNTGHARNYKAYPYGDYSLPDNAQTLFPSSPFGTELRPKELVLGVSVGNAHTAYPLDAMAVRGRSVALNETLGGQPVLIWYMIDGTTARAFDRRLGNRILTLSVADPLASTMTDAETGSLWNGAGLATHGPLAGERLAPLADAYTLFWFAWGVYHPNTRIVR